MREYTYAIQGGSFGDEGKGRVVDEICSRLTKTHKEIVTYRWNGGANAGHTVIIKGKKHVLHQIPSGVTIKQAIAILGKGMVIHPSDLVTEIIKVKNAFNGRLPAKLVIDEEGVLTLDTHRVFEAVLKEWEEGGKASTGRGIAPAYADVLLRHPIRVKDLISRTWNEKLSGHYSLYKALVKGLGGNINSKKVKRLDAKDKAIGSEKLFLSNLAKERSLLREYVKDANDIVYRHWNMQTPFVFEGAQGVGLDPRWGVYPDVTSSNPTFSGIKHSTSGIVDPENIKYRISVYKATYMSSVGKRVLPGRMDIELAKKIREDANEYGATTGRPRDIYHVDIPALNFFAKVTNTTHMVLTHLDISYPNEPIKICSKYTNKEGDQVFYRPDQQYLNNIYPNFDELPSWEGLDLRSENKMANLPRSARSYIYYMAYRLGLEPFMVTTGPERSDYINLSL